MPYDDTEFVDRDFPSPHPATASVGKRPSNAGTGRAPTREDLDAQATATQQQLAKLREAQEQLERARSELEEMRRRRAEFQNGRTDLRDQLTRGIGFLEKAEFDARRDAEQMARSLDGLRTAFGQIESLQEESWTDATWSQELSRGLAVIDNARMELNSARLKWPVLEGPHPGQQGAITGPSTKGLAELPLKTLFRLGLALTWPLLVLGAGAIIVLAFAVLRR
jgi:hypothetical protein